MVNKLIIFTFSLILAGNLHAATVHADPIERTLIQNVDAVNHTTETPLPPDQAAAQISQDYQQMSNTIAIHRANGGSISGNSIFNISVFPVLVSIVHIIEAQCDNLIELITPGKTQYTDEAKVDSIVDTLDAQSTTLSHFISIQNAPTYKVPDYNNPSIPSDMRKTKTASTTQIFGN